MGCIINYKLGSVGQGSAGASGLLGRQVLKELERGGWEVRSLTGFPTQTARAPHIYLTRPQKFLGFLQDFRPLRPEDPRNPTFWEKSDPKLADIGATRLPRGPYRPYLRADKVWARGDPWRPCLQRFVFICGEPCWPKSSKKISFLLTIGVGSSIFISMARGKW